MKIIKVDNCYECRLDENEKIEISCPHMESGKKYGKFAIPSECPLEDYKPNKC